MHNPVIIIGAPRSGTNILRDTLTVFSEVGTWDCDEIPYIWRYGNKQFPTDLLTPEMVTPKIKKYIRSQFDKISRKMNCNNIIEKTCANSLRVGYVDKILPNAKYIFILRNGIDAVNSAMQRWGSKLSLSYTLKKLKYVPLSNIPYYGFNYVGNRLYKISNRNRLKLWGPVFIKPNKLEKYSLEEISAMQWVECVTRANESFEKMNEEKVLRIRYEEFATHPNEITKEIANFIGFHFDNNITLPPIKKTSIGKGFVNLSSSQMNKIIPIVETTMINNNYTC